MEINRGRSLRQNVSPGLQDLPHKTHFSYFWLASAACALSHVINGIGQVLISGVQIQPLFFYVRNPQRRRGSVFWRQR